MSQLPRKPHPVRLDSRPLYTQTIESLTRLISEGAYKAGDKLPKEEELSEQLGISRSTLRVALGYLETHGLISRRPGVGTFVAAWMPDNQKPGLMGGLDRLVTLDLLAEQAGAVAAIAEREVDHELATAEWAGKLGISEGDGLVRVRIVETIDNRRGAYFDTVFPSALVSLDDLKSYQGDSVRYLSRFNDLAPVHTRSEICAIEADEAVAKRLEIPPGKSLLHLEETFYNPAGVAVAFSDNFFLTEVFRFYLIRRVQVHP